MVLVALIKTILIGIYDSLHSAFISDRISDIPYEETANKMYSIYKTIIYATIVAIISILLYVSNGFANKLNRQNDIIIKQIAIIREYRPDYGTEKSLDGK